MSDIKIPELGESVTEARIALFLKENGAIVSEGEEIVEIETEKVNQVLYAPTSGQLSWKVQIGESVKIGDTIGIITASSTAPTPKKEEAKKPETAKKVEVEEEVKQEEGKSRKKMSKIRQTIAKRLVESLRQSAMLTTFNEVDMTKIIELRTKNQDTFTQKFGVKLGFMSFFVKAVVQSLKEYPDLNSMIEGDEIVTFQNHHIGVAVGGAKGGLVVPVLRRAEDLSFSAIEKNIVELATKAREGKLTYTDLQGGTFTITNGGVYGSLLSTPILNPPQSGILGMHKIEKRAVVVDDTIVIRPMMYLALSYDHRIVDGKDAVSFLVKLKEFLETPEKLGNVE